MVTLGCYHQHVVESVLLERLHGDAGLIDGDRLAGVAHQHGRLAERQLHVQAHRRDAELRGGRGRARQGVPGHGHHRRRRQRQRRRPSDESSI